MQHYYGCQYNVTKICIMHGIISLPDTTSYDKDYFGKVTFGSNPGKTFIYRVSTSSGNHEKPGKSLEKVPCMEKSWNLKKTE